jgi:AcrR family transcriptional regulator
VTVGTSQVGIRRRNLVEDRVLDAALACSHDIGFTKVTIDDICRVSGVSRASVYRLFPGGKEVLFEALRVRELNEFFSCLRDEVSGLDSVEDIAVRSVVVASRLLRDDEHLASMLASEPGEALGQLTVEGVPRIIRMATMTLRPLLASRVGDDGAHQLIDVLARLTISYFLAPDLGIDLADEHQARQFLQPLISGLAPQVHDRFENPNHSVRSHS